MLIKNKFIVTVLSFAIVSALIYFSYKSGNNQEYPGFSLFITLSLWYIIGLVAGTIEIIRRRIYLKSNNSTVLYNLTGALNVVISLAGSVFIYIEGGNHFNMYNIFFILPFIMGIVIFKDIYFNKM